MLYKWPPTEGYPLPTATVNIEELDVFKAYIESLS